MFLEISRLALVATLILVSAKGYSEITAQTCEQLWTGYSVRRILVTKVGATFRSKSDGTVGLAVILSNHVNNQGDHILRFRPLNKNLVMRTQTNGTQPISIPVTKDEILTVTLDKSDHDKFISEQEILGSIDLLTETKVVPKSISYGRPTLYPSLIFKVGSDDRFFVIVDRSLGTYVEQGQRPQMMTKFVLAVFPVFPAQGLATTQFSQLEIDGYYPTVLNGTPISQIIPVGTAVLNVHHRVSPSRSNALSASILRVEMDETQSTPYSYEDTYELSNFQPLAPRIGSRMVTP